MKITEICVKKPVLAWMMMAATIVFGLVAGSRIGISQFPDVDFPNISVSVTWEGAAPEVIENDVVEPLEEALIQVEGVKSITSSSRMGGANITLEMNLSRDVDLAMQDVQSKVSQAQHHLPRDIEPPSISKSNPEDQPIMQVALSGPYPAARPERLHALPPEGEAADHPGRGRAPDRRPGAQRAPVARRQQDGRARGDGQRRARRPAARAHRDPGRPPGDRGARGQYPRAGRGPGPGDLPPYRHPRKQRQPGLHQRRGPGRGRLRGRAPPAARQRRAGAGRGHQEAARRQRRGRRPSRCARPWPSSRNTCPRG